ncbi:psbP domain-containing protein 5, chloroplastic isoform X2 [Silene latifolia]|uniref:psbP domain-containing protein 5, chloroplastic isoform X2 n=1 Tax=Silene latifolia TaxID=37657 RepID=UPI003D784B11
MASIFQTPSLFLSNSSSHLSPNLLFRNQSKIHTIWQRKCKIHGKIMATSCISYKPTSEIGFCRRDLLLFSFSTSIAFILPNNGVGAEEDVKMVDFVDDINAYSYSYPVEFPSKKRVFKWVESRKPERYSSAAPLSPNARLRIVSERVDFMDNLIISVSIGPPNPDFLKSKDKSTWNAKDVADSVLSDKSALRVTSSQRLAESSILDAYASEVLEPSNFRQYVASTVERDGYLYTVNASTLNKQWKLTGPMLKKTVESFRLLPPTENYVPPYKDPWRFW